MTKRYSLYMLIAILSCSLGLTAQDVHFSQYYQAPLMLNPALTGNYNCDYQVGVNYRNQWASVTSPYVTFSGFFDMPLSMLNGFDDNDTWAAGIYLYNDQAGDGNLTNFSVLATGAYHKALGRNSEHRLSLGIGIGYTQKRLDRNNLIFGNQWDGDSFDPDNISSNEPFSGNNISSLNTNVGLMWRSQATDELLYEVGATVYNVSSPKETFYTIDPTDNRLGLRYSAHAKLDYSLTDEFSIMPMVFYQTQSKASELVVGSQFGYLINSGTFQAQAILGAHYRLDDAVIAEIGIDYKNVRFGFSYDITTSSLKDAANGVGGFELSLIYRGCVLPVIPKKYVMPCPRY